MMYGRRCAFRASSFRLHFPAEVINAGTDYPYVSVDPQAPFGIFRKDRLRVHLGAARKQHRVVPFEGQLLDLSCPDALAQSRPLLHEADEFEAFRREQRLH